MSTLNELAAASHADATRRGIYPQSVRRSINDIVAEAIEAEDEASGIFHDPEDGDREDMRERLAIELADVLLCTLSTLHDLGVDIDAEVARKMAVNRTRGARA